MLCRHVKLKPVCVCDDVRMVLATSLDELLLINKQSVCQTAFKAIVTTVVVVSVYHMHAYPECRKQKIACFTAVLLDTKLTRKGIESFSQTSSRPSSDFRVNCESFLSEGFEAVAFLWKSFKF